MGRSPAIPLVTTALAALLLVPLAPATAAPDEPRAAPIPGGRETFGNPAERHRTASPLVGPAQTLPADAGATTWHLPTGQGYPRHTRLTEPPVNTADRSIKLGLAPYHAIAPRLNDLQRVSDRVSVEVIGQSTTGRDLYLVTVTAPESRAEAARQDRMRERIENDPARAARDREIQRDYKVPVLVNNNIHGNEWEGTDAALRLIESLATSADPETEELLATTRLYFNVTANPDGRVAGTRANAAGFDMNRDFVTASQPEVRALRQVVIDTQPAVMLDLHGYVNGTLIEPTTPPHGENYEYDLFLANAYRNALGMERAVLDLGLTPEQDGVHPPQIPFRDAPEGWDDWPPIFTPQYVAFHGAVAAHTVEIPLRVNNADYLNLSETELRRRAAVNTDVAEAVMRAATDFTVDHRERLIADQIEVFRRGAAGEAQRPVSAETVPGVPGIGPEDVYTTDFPRAYVIPAGDGQRSATAAARLVDHLVANDVRVRRATADFRLGGTRYPAGSYVVDMHQPKRGLANTILAAGTDISDKVDAMYDISGWSHGLLWGATVDRVEDGRPAFPGRDVTVAAPTGSVPAWGPFELVLADGRDVAALNDLLRAGVEVSWTGAGTVRVPAAERAAAREVADRYGVTFTRAAGRPREAEPLEAVTVAAAAASDEVYTLREMGFEVVPVSTGVLAAGFDWDAVDVLYVSSGLDHAALPAAARAELDAFLAEGGVVTRGATGAAFNAAAGLLTATATPGRRDANGVVAVDNRGPLAATAPEHGFVYSPLWFTALGPEVTVQQTYAPDDVLTSGHWRAAADGGAGPDAAAGQPSMISGIDERGAAVVMFGTEPLFRNHPKGSFAGVGQALYWAAIGG
ncbi:M14 family zinc carboxypeptidase [Allostreptomyces psammosilenae]|uniref:Putative deacylase n=1 Tax=Allostreptomyces psammosilenae TaxID=1892865 RepID=A0A852ZSZ7_9ACTN|nr:M14 family zinc carboxypeptidase [Allostreptomyces psammosilenae]NYI04955.1 putative deacylase [Allostreptomyces psammosilenae]